MGSPTTRWARASWLLVMIVLAPFLGSTRCAQAAQTARLQVGLVPERPGQATTIEFGFTISRLGGGVPSPVTRIDLRYPAHLGIVTSGLGVASCTRALLEADGPEGCPSQSLMGYGTATAEVQVGEEIIQEAATTAVLMAPLAEGNINLLFFVDGYTPLGAQLLFPGLLLPASAPYGGDLSIIVPLLESFPEGPDVALVRLRSTIGALGLIYYQRSHGRFVPYRPSGIILPARCPKRGFPFAVAFQFADGSTTTSRARVPCQREHRPPGR